MRWALLVTILLPQFGYCQPTIPSNRWNAPQGGSELLRRSNDQLLFGDSVLTNDHRLKHEYVGLSGIVVSLRGDTTLASIAQYNEGRRSGTWYTLDGPERVTEVVEYASNNSHRSYWYDNEGLLSYYCEMTKCHDDTFDRIFGGWCPGTCWSLDSDKHVTYKIEQTSPDDQSRTWYYPNGQKAERTAHGRSTGIVEQWCPRGKRVGYMTIVSDSAHNAIRKGSLLMWSKSEYSYFIYRANGDVHMLRALHQLRWQRFTEKEYSDRDKELQLEGIVFDDPKRPVSLPCAVRRW